MPEPRRPSATEHLRRLFEHAAWADRRALEALAATPEDRRAPALRLLAHLLAAERVWLLRLQGEDSSAQPIWPGLGLDECEALAAENRSAYARYLAALTEEAAGSEVAYTSSQGAAFRSRVSDVLTHVALHGAYHRGQVATILRSAGAEPANTDFIMFAREGL